MKRIAIVGGGMAGVSAAYELTRLASPDIEFVLFEAASRLGGIVETVRLDDFIIECGPDSWVTEKPWARELAVELGLESELIDSLDEHRRTYLAENGKFQAMPDGMRMMVPVEWDSVLASPLFSEQAKLDYQREPQRAAHLKATALEATNPPRDESVKDFVVRHFGNEVAETIAAPLLAGVFGGDIGTLSARAVLPAFVALERKYGSLILGLQQQRKLAATSTQPIFTSLRRGLSSLIEAMESRIHPANIRRGCKVDGIILERNTWRIREASSRSVVESFDAILVATPARTTAELLGPIDRRVPELLPRESSSAVVVAFGFSPHQAVRIPAGFGFLVPQREGANTGRNANTAQALLACTFVDQKFPSRAPAGGVLLRAFFGGATAPSLLSEDDGTFARLAYGELDRILGKLPQPIATVVRSWPDSLPLYTVGHLERIAELESCMAQLPNIRLIGNAYRGVGLPDMIHQGRTAAREIVATLRGSDPAIF